MSSPSNGKLIIRVAPDTGAPLPLPQVIVSMWDVQGQPQIEWQPISDSTGFVFKRFLTDSDAFKNVTVTDDLIKCEYDKEAALPHEYDIEIEVNGVSYDTQQRSGPDPGRPVIRR